ncbi:unnamed protein product, partial [marine sediment metagenome]
TRTESPLHAVDGQDGKRMLSEITGGLIAPLSSVGTRVVIVDPVDELIEDIKNGNFLRCIGETWWEIILKYNANIKLRAFGQEQTVTIPKEFPLAEDDSKRSKVWI